jgi:ribonuclease HII
MRKHELALVDRGFVRIVGVDEAGRGPLAGPVVAAACHLPPNLELEDEEAAVWLQDIADSKALSASQRDELYEKLTSHPRVAWAAHSASAQEIDSVNILQATMGCMHGAVAKMDPAADFVLVDGTVQTHIAIGSSGAATDRRSVQEKLLTCSPPPPPAVATCVAPPARQPPPVGACGGQAR